MNGPSTAGVCTFKYMSSTDLILKLLGAISVEVMNLSKLLIALPRDVKDTGLQGQQAQLSAYLTILRTRVPTPAPCSKPDMVSHAPAAPPLRQAVKGGSLKTTSSQFRKRSKGIGRE